MIPRTLLKFAFIVLDQRLGETLIATHEVHAITALDAQHTIIGRGAFSTGHADNLIGLTIDVKIELTAYSAIRTNCFDDIELPGTTLALAQLVRHRAGRAQLNTLATLYAGGFTHGSIVITDDFRIAAAIAEVEDFVNDRGVTANNAASTCNAFAVVFAHEFGRSIGLSRLVIKAECRALDPQVMIAVSP